MDKDEKLKRADKKGLMSKMKDVKEMLDGGSDPTQKPDPMLHKSRMPVERRIGEISAGILIGGYEALHKVPSNFRFQVSLETCKFVKVSREELLNVLRTSRMFASTITEHCQTFYEHISGLKEHAFSAEANFEVFKKNSQRKQPIPQVLSFSKKSEPNNVPARMETPFEMQEVFTPWDAIEDTLFMYGFEFDKAIEVKGKFYSTASILKRDMLVLEKLKDSHAAMTSGDGPGAKEAEDVFESDLFQHHRKSARPQSHHTLAKPLKSKISLVETTETGTRLEDNNSLQKSNPKLLRSGLSSAKSVVSHRVESGILIKSPLQNIRIQSARYEHVETTKPLRIEINSAHDDLIERQANHFQVKSTPKAVKGSLMTSPRFRPSTSASSHRLPIRVTSSIKGNIRVDRSDLGLFARTETGSDSPKSKQALPEGRNSSFRPLSTSSKKALHDQTFRTQADTTKKTLLEQKTLPAEPPLKYGCF